MSETWYARFFGGPMEGATVPIDGSAQPFPGPEIFVDMMPLGRYVRGKFSQLPENYHPSIVRGAEFNWEDHSDHDVETCATCRASAGLAEDQD